MITDSDIVKFTTGGCLILAEEISGATGWPVCAFSTPDYPDEPDVHAFNRTPDGLYLDVEGIRSDAQMLERWKVWEPTGIGTYDDPAAFDESWIQPGDYDSGAYQERARQLVPELIAMAEKRT